MLNARVTPIRFGIIGAGAIAKAHAAAICELPQAKLVAVADVDPVAAQLFGAQNDCRSFTALENLLQGSAPDVVVICTPPATHEHLVITAVRAGVHVLCEKPLAVDLKSAHAMTEAAAAAGVILTMATKFRYVDDIIKARNMIRLGVLGDILLIANEFRSTVDMSKRWNARPELSGGGVIIDNGTHSVDILRYLVGPLEAVRAVEGEQRLLPDVEDCATVFTRFADGAFGIVELSWSHAATSPYFVQIVGSLGRVAIGWKESHYRLGNSNDWRELGNGYNKIEAFKKQYENVIGVVLGRSAVEVGHADALASVAVVSAAYASLKNGGWNAVNGSVPLKTAPEGADRALALL